MSPRPYNLGLRKEAADDTHEKIVSAAEQLLAEENGDIAFSMEAVAKKADVVRMTVYNRFKSKRGLVEAVFDDIARRGQLMHMPSVFAQSNSVDALDLLITIFGEFWDSDRLVIRRIRALGALDQDIGQALRDRDQNRLQLVQAILGRMVQETGRPLPEDFSEEVNILCTLIGFEFFDALAGPGKSLQAIVPEVQRLARAALNLPVS